MNTILLEENINAIKSKVLIFGAHLVAMELKRWLETLGKSIVGFAVSNMTDNPKEIEGFPVRKINEYIYSDDIDDADSGDVAEDMAVIIASPKKYHSEIEKTLYHMGFRQIYKISLEELSIIKGKYLMNMSWSFRKKGCGLRKSDNDPTWLDLIDIDKRKLICKFPTLFYLDKDTLCERVEYADFKNILTSQYEYCDYAGSTKRLSARYSEPSIRDLIKIYMAYGLSDIGKVEESKYEEWVSPIQVGAALYGRENGPYYDNEGDNISEKNPLFAEMTAAYWVWKNARKSKYKGLCHYRRHFDIDRNSIEQFIAEDIDVVLTTMRYAPGGVGRMFAAETPVRKVVMERMISAIGELDRGDIEGFQEYLAGEFYSPNNMIIARNAIYDEYSAWIFPILFRMYEMDIEAAYEHFNDRHIAYAAELLTSYYVMGKRKDLKKAFVEYRFLE